MKSTFRYGLILRDFDDQLSCGMPTCQVLLCLYRALRGEGVFLVYFYFEATVGDQIEKLRSIMEELIPEVGLKETKQ